ncbi:MAG: hypothetical protein K2X82_01790, partial [Gemmataceae bacterium]|nr:hypothetical protein [Gemmataceae bacterium]
PAADVAAAHHDEPSAEPAAAVADHTHTPAAEAEEVAAPPAEPEVVADAEPDTAADVQALAVPETEPTAPTADEPEPAVAVEAATAEEPAEAAEPEAVADVPAAEAPAEPAPPPPVESNKKWYVVKVQSNREESIKAAVERQVKIQGLEEFFGQIVIPVEEYYEKKKVSVKDKKTGQKVTEERNVAKHRKKYPGYLFAEVEFNDRILYVFRETSGVGDFVGATHHRAPSPMPDREVQQMLTGVADPNAKKDGRKIKVKLDFEKGDKVRIRDGAFAGSEAEVKAITEPKDPTDPPKVTVVVTIWGRPVEMEMDAFQMDKA